MRSVGAPTWRQSRLLKFIVEYRIHHGFPPTIREMTVAIGNRASSVNGTLQMLQALELKGLVRRAHGKPRTTRVTESGYDALAYDPPLVSPCVVYTWNGAL